MRFSGLLAGVALVALVASAQAGGNGPGVTATEIKLGNTMPYSGPASGYGTQGRTEDAYYAMINAKGGVNGRKINFISLDDSYNPPKTVEQARRLVEQDEVLALMGPLGTPTNSAIQKYMNAKKVPQLFISSGAAKWNDPKNFPWTTSLLPPYTAEASIYGADILKNAPNAKIGVLYQNDDFGKDFVRGLKQGLGERADGMIVKEMTYEVTDPTVDSQIIALKAAGADVIVDITTPKFGAQVIKKVADLGWKPRHYVVSVASSIKSVLEPAGLDNAVGLFTAIAVKTPTDPRWKDSKDVQDFIAFLRDYYPKGDPGDMSNVSGYISGFMTVKLLEKCGDDLSRDNLLKQATSFSNVAAPLLLPGLTLSNSPTDYNLFHQLQVARFDGKTWEPVGPMIDVGVGAPSQ